MLPTATLQVVDSESPILGHFLGTFSNISANILIQHTRVMLFSKAAIAVVLSLQTGYPHKKQSSGVNSLELGQLTALVSQMYYGIECSVACGTILLKPHVNQVQLFHFGQKEVHDHLTVPCSIDRIVTAIIVFEKY